MLTVDARRSAASRIEKGREKIDMSDISLPRPYASPIQLQHRIGRLAALLAFALVVAAAGAKMLEPSPEQCRELTIGVSAIGSCDWIGGRDGSPHSGDDSGSVYAGG